MAIFSPSAFIRASSGTVTFGRSCVSLVMKLVPPWTGVVSPTALSNYRPRHPFGKLRRRTDACHERRAGKALGHKSR